MVYCICRRASAIARKIKPSPAGGTTMENFRPCHVRYYHDGPIIRTIPLINRSRSADSLCKILHDIGEIDLTVTQGNYGRAGQVLIGRVPDGFWSRDCSFVFPENYFTTGKLHQAIVMMVNQNKKKPLPVGT